MIKTEDLKIVHNLLGKIPSKDAYDRLGTYNGETISRRFGTPVAGLDASVRF